MALQGPEPEPESAARSEAQVTDIAKIEMCQLEPQEAPYTTWSTRKRRLVTLLLGYLALASSLTANAHFPLVNTLADQTRTSLQDINLTITVFFIFQGIAPSFWSPLSDTLGRRPVYLGTFLVYTGGSLGLVLYRQSYVALLVSRALQSIGGSAVLSLSYAVVSDICVHSERGSFIAPMMAAANVGPLLGPIIGGGSALATGSPDWCFRGLFIFGGTGLVLIGFTLPETLRSIVGNGSVKARGIWETWWTLFKPHTLHRESTSFESQATSLRDDKDPKIARPSATSTSSDMPTGRGSMVMPNPLPVLRIVGYPDTFLVLWLAASPYTLWFSVQTAITPILAAQYSLNPFQISLCFLAGGIGIIAGGFMAGKLMDRNYVHVALKAGLSVDKRKGDDMTHFPIEHARSRWTIRIVLASLCCVVGYGWAVALRAHLAILLVLQCCVGLRCTVLHQTYSALLVDVFQERSGTAAAANNIVRCTLSGYMVAALEPLAGAIGYGWMYTALGLVDAVGCVAAVLVLRRYGKGIRDRRRLKAMT